MRPKTLALLAVAAMCGLVAMMGVQQVLSNQNDGQPDTGMVLVAKAEIAPGVPLDESNVEFKAWPKGTIPEGAVVQKEQIQDRTLKVRAFPGDLILEAKLDKKGVRNASSGIPKGKCVASVPIDPTMTGIGLIHPGDRVDVLVTYKPAQHSRDVNAGIGKEVKTVLENVEVFAIDGVTDANMIARPGDTKAAATKANNVSLLLTNQQAPLLKLAQDVGVIHLTLRAMNDDSRVDPKDLFDPSQAERALARESEVERNAMSNVKPEPEPVPDVKVTKSRKWKIEIIAGTERRIEEIDLPEEEPSTPTGPKGT